MNMSSSRNSSDFLDETIGSIAASKKVPKVEELSLERPVDRKKLVLRFYRFEAPIVNCANEEQFKKICEWKVTLLSAP